MFNLQMQTVSGIAYTRFFVNSKYRKYMQGLAIKTAHIKYHNCFINHTDDSLLMASTSALQEISEFIAN